jgi:hypothetical protein
MFLCMLRAIPYVLGLVGSKIVLLVNIADIGSYPIQILFYNRVVLHEDDFCNCRKNRHINGKNHHVRHVLRIFALPNRVVIVFFDQILFTPADSPPFYGFLFETPTPKNENIIKYVALASEIESATPRVHPEILANRFAKDLTNEQNRILAAVFAWRADHDNYYGLCDADCDRSGLKSLIKKLDSSLSKQEKSITSSIENSMYWNLVMNYRLYYALSTLSPILVALCSFLITSRAFRRSR